MRKRPRLREVFELQLHAIGRGVHPSIAQLRLFHMFPTRTFAQPGWRVNSLLSRFGRQRGGDIVRENREGQANGRTDVEERSSAP